MWIVNVSRTGPVGTLPVELFYYIFVYYLYSDHDRTEGVIESGKENRKKM